MINNQCKICRRLGAKLFLKGDRCLGSKCAIVKRPYAPGEKAKKRSRGGSEYSKELSEKQKLKNWYNLREKKFSAYVRNILASRDKNEDAGSLLIRQLESRLDNVVFRLGFSESRRQAKQLVGHGHFLVNKRKVNIPSYQLKLGDIVSLSEASKNRAYFKNVLPILKKRETPAWLKFNLEKMEAEVSGYPNLEETASPAELSAIFEFYSK